MEKCNHGDWKFCPDGKHELDPCIYREILRLRNVTVQILKCEKCGHITVGWFRQENTEDVTDDDLSDMWE